MPERPAPMQPLTFTRHAPEQMLARAAAFSEEVSARRSVREFSDEPVPDGVLRRCIEAAAQAPSGANKQPWTFVLVTNPDVKRRIRAAAEEEERAFYGGRASERWLEDLEPLGTGWEKPFLVQAPALIVIFAQKHGPTLPGPGGVFKAERHYYVSESVGIAAGFLLVALHHAGLAALTHTPSPMGFLADILGRPENERPYLLIPVGYPAPGCEVPAITRKPLDDVLVSVE
jgi:iodotyrosine deiodinase